MGLKTDLPVANTLEPTTPARGWRQVSPLDIDIPARPAPSGPILFWSTPPDVIYDFRPRHTRPRRIPDLLAHEYRQADVGIRPLGDDVGP